MDRLLHKKATPWVSYFVLVGCICITLGLVYVTRQAVAIAEDWNMEVEGDMYR